MQTAKCFLYWVSPIKLYRDLYNEVDETANSLVSFFVAQVLQAAEKVLFCHPERSEGSAFLRQTQEKADSSGRPSPSE